MLAEKVSFDEIEEQAKDAAEVLIETWNQYLSGDVYGYRLFYNPADLNEDEIDDMDELDSCWGFYGDDVKENGMEEHFSPEIHMHKEMIDNRYKAQYLNTVGAKSWESNFVFWHVYDSLKWMPYSLVFQRKVIDILYKTY